MLLSKLHSYWTPLINEGLSSWVSQITVILGSEIPFTICYTIAIQQIILSATSHSYHQHLMPASDTCSSVDSQPPTDPPIHSHTQCKIPYWGGWEAQRLLSSGNILSEPLPRLIWGMPDSALYITNTSTYAHTHIHTSFAWYHTPQS